MSTKHDITVESPVGWLRLRASERGLTGVEFVDGPGDNGASNGVLRQAAAELAEYFAGTRREFDLPLAAEGTEFQRRVWEALLRIPFGVTRSYLDVAREVGGANAVRAVGGANGANPIAVIVPCHRVIASDGTLHGYGGGLERKKWLLEHERCVAGVVEGLFAGKAGV